MARVDDHTPDLWKLFETATAEVAALWEPEKKKDPAAEPSLETFTRIAEKTVAPVLTLFRLNPFASKTDEIDYDLPSDKDLQEAERQRDLGEAYLLDGDYERSVEAYEKAVGLDSSYADDPLVVIDLGKARFGLKDYKGSREAYGVALALASRHDETRRLHLEASQKYLGTLDQKKDAEEVSVVEKDIVADQAMLVALEADKERREIKELGRELSKNSPQSPDEARKILDQVNGLAQNYLVYGSADFSDPKDAAFVRGELNALAGETFQVLCSLSSTSVYEEIRKRTPLYEGYFFLTEGNVDLASEKFEKVREEIPEADEILKRLAEDRTRASKQVEVNRLRSINLAVLDAWEAYIEEGTAVEVDQVNGWLGQGLQLVGGQTESKVRSRWARDDMMVGSIRRKIKSGKCETVHAALEEMAKGDDSEAKRARSLLENEWDGSRNGNYLLEHLIAYASNLESKEYLENQLLDDADQANARYGAAQMPSWVYAILQETASNETHKELAEQRIEELKNGKGLGQQILDMIRTTGTDDLVQIALMAGASKVGSLTKLAALNRLQKAGVTGYKAVLLAGGAEVLAEGTTLWALNTLHESATHDVNKVFSADHLLKSYGATLVMLPFIKLSSAGGKNAGTSLARRLGMVAAGGSPLSRWGKVFAGGVTHTFGAGGMVAASQTNQGFGLVPVAPGGFKGTLVHEVFGYAKYAFAGGAFHKVLGAKHAEAHEKLQNDIAIKKAAVLTEGHLKALGHRANSRVEDGSPVYELPEVQDFFGQMVFLSLSRPGFSGRTLVDLVAKGQQAKAESYLRSFGLKPTYEGKKFTGIEELSLHEELGIVPSDNFSSDRPEIDVLAREAVARPLPLAQQENHSDLRAQNGPWAFLGRPIGQRYSGGVLENRSNEAAPSVPELMAAARDFLNTARAEQWRGKAADYYRADLAMIAKNLQALEPIYQELYGKRTSFVDFKDPQNLAKAKQVTEGLQHAAREIQRLKSSPHYKPEVTSEISPDLSSKPATPFERKAAKTAEGTDIIDPTALADGRSGVRTNEDHTLPDNPQAKRGERANPSDVTPDSSPEKKQGLEKGAELDPSLVGQRGFERGLMPLKWILSKIATRANHEAAQNGSRADFDFSFVRAIGTDTLLRVDIHVSNETVKADVWNTLEKAGVQYDRAGDVVTVNGHAVELRFHVDGASNASAESRADTRNTVRVNKPVREEMTDSDSSSHAPNFLDALTPGAMDLSWEQSALGRTARLAESLLPGLKAFLDGIYNPTPAEALAEKAAAYDGKQEPQKARELFSSKFPFDKVAIDFDKSNINLRYRKDQNDVIVEFRQLRTTDGKNILDKPFRLEIRVNERGETEAFLRSLFLKQEFQGMGVGKALFDASMAMAKEMGAARFRLKASDEGRTTWPRENFGFRFENFGSVRQAYSEWVGSKEGGEFLASEPGKIWLEDLAARGIDVRDPAGIIDQVGPDRPFLLLAKDPADPRQFFRAAKEIDPAGNAKPIEFLYTRDIGPSESVKTSPPARSRRGVNDAEPAPVRPARRSDPRSPFPH